MPEKKISCLAVDDEPPALDVLRKYISSVQSLELVGTCSDAVEALNSIRQRSVDLIFLDIQMPQILGTDFLRTLKNPPKVIFTTAYRKYAVEGFELDAVDYLLKPISFERFLKAVNKVLQLNIGSAQAMPTSATKEKQNGESNSFLYFRAERKMVKVFFRDILFVEGLKDYIRIVTDNKTIITKYVLSTLEEMLPANEFLRIHKSYIIALSLIHISEPTRLL